MTYSPRHFLYSFVCSSISGPCGGIIVKGIRLLKIIEKLSDGLTIAYLGCTSLVDHGYTHTR